MASCDFGVGVDIEDVGRFRLGSGSRLVKRVFTPKETKYCFGKAHPEKHLSARFAGKEAVIKAVSSLGLEPPTYGEIEILNDDKGVPCVSISKKYSRLPLVKVSLSHLSDKAVASAVAFWQC